MLAACAVLFGVYALLSLANDPRGYLGTDTGAKVATLRAMVHNGGLDPDVGYWAAKWDPEGTLHPLYQTVRYGDRWVVVTTLPALYAAYPLFRLGGFRAALVLPMLGSVAAALAARAIAQRVGGSRRDGWLAFWVIGLASPLTVYALDFWEHSLGVALLAWAVVWLLDLTERGGLHRALAAGAAIGLAATMRTEALVYGAVASAVTGVVLLARRRAGRAVASAVAVGTGFALLWGANAVLERATVGESIRAGRTRGILADASAKDPTVLPERWREAAVTGFSLHASLELSPAVGGAVAATALAAGLALSISRGQLHRAVVLMGAAGALYAVRIAQGPGFIPGLFAAFPLAAAGVALGWRTEPARRVLAVALLSLPLVWAFQFRGGAPPQWGGRYILTSSLLLGAIGIGAFGRAPGWARGFIVGLSVAVTALGLAWLAIRSHEFARVSDVLDNRPEPVLVSRIAFFVREGGSVYGTRWDHRWLTAELPQAFERAAQVLECAGVTAFGAVETVGDAPPQQNAGNYRLLSEERVPFFADLRVTRYELVGGGVQDPPEFCVRKDISDY